MGADSPDRTLQLRDLLDRLEGPLLRYAQRLSGSVEIAREIVQDAFMRLCADDRAWRHNPAAWLYAVCRHRAIDFRRKESRMHIVDGAEFDRRSGVLPPPEGAAEQRDLSLQVQRLLERLPPNQQEAIRLRFQGGLSYKEIAAVMSLTATNVGFLIHSGVKALRERIDLLEGAAERRGGGAAKAQRRGLSA